MDPRTRRLHDTVLVPLQVVHPSRTAPRNGHERRTFFPEQEGAMPLIKPRTRGKQLVKHRTRLDSENNETLYAYAHFLGESTEYVLNQVIDTVLARDKEFIKWRESHSGSYVTRAKQHQRRTSSAPRRPRADAESSGEAVVATAVR